MKMPHIILFFCVSVFACGARSFSQERPDTSWEQIQILKRQLEEIRRELADLKELKTEAATDRSDELDRLEEKLEQRLQELENKIDATSRATAPIVFNPRTTAFLNFAARADDEVVRDSKSETEIQNRPFLRTVELDLRAPVDPFAEAVTIIAIEDEAGKGFELDAEEAYGLIKRLPVLESAPLGMKVKIGKFRAPLGVNNKLHMHDLPWTTRPLIVSKYLGTEHGEFFESGFNPIGVDFDFFLPSPIRTSTLELNLEILRAGDLAFSPGGSGRQPAVLGHLNWSRDWRNEHLLALGLSAYGERGSGAPRLFGADFTYKWLPAERRDRHSFVLGGEILWGKNRIQVDGGTQDIQPDGTLQVENNPLGWFAYVQYQLSWWSYLGLRYEQVEEPTNDKLKTTSIAGYLSYYTTEFLRFRLGIEHRKSDLAAVKSVTSGLFEVNFVFGSHPTEPYWVSR